METKFLQVRAWVSCKQPASVFLSINHEKATLAFLACSTVYSKNLSTATKARCRTGLSVLGRASSTIAEIEELDGL